MTSKPGANPDVSEDDEEEGIEGSSDQDDSDDGDLEDSNGDDTFGEGSDPVSNPDAVPAYEIA